MTLTIIYINVKQLSKECLNLPFKSLHYHVYVLAIHSLHFFLYFFINIKYLSYSKELMLNIQKPHKIGFCEHLKTDRSLNFFLNEINLADLRNPVFR